VTLGAEFAAFVAEMLQADGGFGSTLQWRHFVRVENAGTGAVTETPATPNPAPFRGGLTDPVRTRLFGEATLLQARTAVVVPAGALPWDPALLDQVEVVPGHWMRVIDVKELFGPGDSGAPVLIAVVAALGVS
jgi:hypothetical protein